MAFRTKRAASPAPLVETILPLENGDRLTRAEFERRYEAMPGLKKAELIKGAVYVPSPVNHKKHANPHFVLIGWLGHYQISTPGVEGGDNGSLRLDLDSEPQPDAYLLIAPAQGGQARIDADGLYKSEVLPGLWLNPAALIRGDLASAVQALRQGLASPEHTAFVARLQQTKE